MAEPENEVWTIPVVRDNRIPEGEAWLLPGVPYYKPRPCHNEVSWEWFFQEQVRNAVHLPIKITNVCSGI